MAQVCCHKSVDRQTDIFIFNHLYFICSRSEDSKQYSLQFSPIVPKHTLKADPVRLQPARSGPRGLRHPVPCGLKPHRARLHGPLQMDGAQQVPEELPCRIYTCLPESLALDR